MSDIRTDCTIDRRSIKCPNASRLGFDKGTASVGDLVVYKEHYANGEYQTRVGRMLGRVSAPKLEHNDKEIKGFALLMVLSQDCTFVMERWVDPADIVQVRDVPSNMLAFFGQATLPDAKTLRTKLAQGYITDRYLIDSGLLDTQAA